MNKLKTLLALGLLAAAVEASPIFLLPTQTASGAPNGIGCVNAGQVCGSYIATVDFTSGVNVTNFIPVTGYVATGEEIFDIAINTAGEIYGITASRLYKLNYNVGTNAYNLAFILNHGINGGNALAFAASGLLYAAGNESRLTQIDIGTNSVTHLAGWAPSFGSGGDLAFVGSALYLGTTSQQIVEVDPNTGAVGTQGPGGMGVTAFAIKGLAADGSNLYVVYQIGGGQELLGLVDLGGSFGNVTSGFNLETASGLLNTAGTFGLPSGMANFAQVPEPSTLLLSVIGLGLVGFGRRKRN